MQVANDSNWGMVASSAVEDQKKSTNWRIGVSESCIFAAMCFRFHQQRALGTRLAGILAFLVGIQSN